MGFSWARTKQGYKNCDLNLMLPALVRTGPKMGNPHCFVIKENVCGVAEERDVRRNMSPETLQLVREHVCRFLDIIARHLCFIPIPSTTKMPYTPANTLDRLGRRTCTRFNLFTHHHKKAFIRSFNIHPSIHEIKFSSLLHQFIL